MQPGFRFLADYYSAIARLMRAGLPLPRAAGTASRALPAERVAAALEAGEEPESAFLKAGFPNADCMVIGLGATAGRLDAVLDELARHYERLNSARRTVISKSLYPLLVIHLAAVLLAIPPAVLGGEAAIFWVRVATTLGLVYALGAGIAGLMIFSLRLHANSPRAAAALERVPLFGGWIQAVTGARFASVFALIVRAGAGPLRGLEAAGRACGNARLREAASRAVADGRRGESIARAFEKLSPRPIAQALELGQASGGLDSEMARVGEQLEAAAHARLESLSEWLPRILYLLIVAYVGWRIVATAMDVGKSIGEALDPGF